jgi:hypothetical protein
LKAAVIQTRKDGIIFDGANQRRFALKFVELMAWSVGIVFNVQLLKMHIGIPTIGFE